MTMHRHFIFTHKELVTILIKAQNIREGLWMLGAAGRVEGNLLGLASESLPGVTVTLTHVSLHQADNDSPGPGLVVDAAKVNSAEAGE